MAALVVVNSAGSCVLPRSGRLAALDLGLADEFGGWANAVPRPVTSTSAGDPGSTRNSGTTDAPGTPPLNTTLVVLATDLSLTKAQCAKLAGLGHDGLARAINPVHTMFDGDTVFALATGDRAAPAPDGVHLLLGAAADCVSRAVGHAMLAATTVTTPAGTWLGYPEWAGLR